MRHERLQVRMLAYALERRAQRVPLLYFGFGAVVGLLFALIPGVVPERLVWVAAACALLGLLAGIDRADLLRGQAHWMLAWADDTDDRDGEDSSGGGERSSPLQRRISGAPSAGESALPPSRSGVHAIDVPADASGTSPR